MDYTEIKEEGNGAFARVFEVRGDDGHTYAKKVFSPDPTLVKNVGEEHLRKRFVREVKCQKSIDHHNVVPIIEDHLSLDPPYFIMPFAPASLKDDIEADPTLGGNPSKPLYDVLAGLEEVHSQGFVHRDLKPANILRLDDGEGNFRYAIADLGLISDPDGGESTLTATNTQGGSLYYAAPELTRSFKHATASADIYSFGAILHDIFTNRAARTPYTELTADGPIGEVISKCTKVLPIRRYPTIAALREELFEALNNETIVFSSSNEKAIIELLDSEAPLNDDQWDRVFLFIEDSLNNNTSLYNVFASIKSSHIEYLHNNAPELFSALGSYFSDYVREGTFNFDYCDVLANKLQMFYKYGDIGLQSEATVAMLVMGTSHNRWYVEGKFMEMASEKASEALAQRILIELEIHNINFKAQMAHVARSIHVDKEDLHPKLLESVS